MLQLHLGIRGPSSTVQLAWRSVGRHKAWGRDEKVSGILNLQTAAPTRSHDTSPLPFVYLS